MTITFDHVEKRNAITIGMFEELGSHLSTIADDPDARVVVLTGAGDAFSSGADLTDEETQQALGGGQGAALSALRRVQQVALALHEFPKPTIAAVNGVAAGAGLNLALGCDLVIASENARFMEAFIHHGLVLDCGGHWLLPRLVGLHRAKQIAFLGETIRARDAESAGLVNQVVADSELEATVSELAERLAALPPISLSLMKRGLNRSFETDFAASLDVETASQSVVMSSADVAEALAAFRARRTPVFRGE